MALVKKLKYSRVQYCNNGILYFVILEKKWVLKIEKPFLLVGVAL